LGFERLKDLYIAKGYPKEWVDTRLKSIDIRKQLTDEWQQRSVKEGQEYAILTAEIAKATFSLTPTEHKNVKGLERQNLRDHMTNLELIFTMLGEESTRQYAVENDAQGFEENHESAQKGGNAAGSALKNYEATTGKTIVSETNFLKQIKEENEE
jgi:DNA-damage-inducible protein D